MNLTTNINFLHWECKTWLENVQNHHLIVKLIVINIKETIIHVYPQKNEKLKFHEQNI